MVTSDAALRTQLNALLDQVDNPSQSTSDLIEIADNLPLIRFLDLRYLGQATGGGGGGGGSGPGPGGLTITPQVDGSDLVVPTGITQLIRQPDGTDLLVAAGTVSIVREPDGSDLVSS